MKIQFLLRETFPAHNHQHLLKKSLRALNNMSYTTKFTFPLGSINDFFLICVIFTRRPLWLSVLQLFILWIKIYRFYKNFVKILCYLHFWYLIFGHFPSLLCQNNQSHQKQTLNYISPCDFDRHINLFSIFFQFNYQINQLFQALVLQRCNWPDKDNTPPRQLVAVVRHEAHYSEEEEAAQTTEKQREHWFLAAASSSADS